MALSPDGAGTALTWDGDAACHYGFHREEVRLQVASPVAYAQAWHCLPLVHGLSALVHILNKATQELTVLDTLPD